MSLGPPDGGFRLHWYAGGVAVHEDFPCLDDALDKAGRLYIDGIRQFVALDNWLGENACPDDQLLPVAKIRAEGRLLRRDHDAMTSGPAWGAFG
jgi:hypothetical protein